jgi:hypothetical protein
MFKGRYADITWQKRIFCSPQCEAAHAVEMEELFQRQLYFEPQLEPEQYEPTHWQPGTDEKIKVLRERFSQGLPMWHPWDNKSFAGVDLELKRSKASCRSQSQQTVKSV